MAAPGLCARGGNLYVAWSDHHQQPQQRELHTLRSSDGGAGWDHKASLGETSEHGPAICEFNGRLYIAWTGTHGGAHLNVTSTPDGSSFSPQSKVTLKDTASAFGPALTAFNNRLYLAWVDHDSPHIFIRSSANGTSFDVELEPLNRPSIGAPALQVAHTGSSPSGDPGLLLLAWTDLEHRMRIAGSKDGLNFRLGGGPIDGETSEYGPALLTAQLAPSTASRVYIAWTGTGPRHTINTMPSDDPEKFSNGFNLITKQTFDNARSLDGPSLTGLFNDAQPKFFMGYTQAADHHLKVDPWQPPGRELRARFAGREKAFDPPESGP